MNEEHMTLNPLLWHPEDRYEATQDLDKICNEFRDSGLSF